MNKCYNKTLNHFKLIKLNSRHCLSNRNKTVCSRWNKRNFNFSRLCKLKTQMGFKIRPRNKMNKSFWMKTIMCLNNSLSHRKSLRTESSIEIKGQFKSRKLKLLNKMGELNSNKFKKSSSNNNKINKLQIVMRCLINKIQLML